MRRFRMVTAMAPLLLAAGSALADGDDHGFTNRSLKGDYALTGSASCLVSLDGFNDKFQPIGTNFFSTFFVAQGIRTFNGDGTGTVHDAYSVSVTPPPNVTPSATAVTFTEPFTYDVAPDGSFTTTLDPSVSGTVTAGPLAGQTFTEVGFATQGQISADGSVLTLGAQPTPMVETITFSGGLVEPRICTRSFTLIKLKSAHDEH